MLPNTVKNIEVSNSEAGHSPKLSEVLQLNSTSAIRTQIGLIADSSYRDTLISEEAYYGYKALAERREEHEISAEMLEKTKEFAEEHETRAIRISGKLQKAMSAGIASFSDEHFLMDKLVVNNISFLQDADKIESQIDQKLVNLKRDREIYHELMNHELVKGIGYLKVGPGKRIEMVNEEKYMEMTVPERREFLKKAKEALPKAEFYAESLQEEISEKSIANYKAKLLGAKNRRIIGETTYEKFLKGIENPKLDNEERKHWLAEFDGQMERYETLWKDIRSTLKGRALKKMEGKIDKFGYTEVFTSFGKMKQVESTSLNENYALKLEIWNQQGVIGRHTMAKFTAWMLQKNLTQKYDALEALDGEMKRYKTLWNDIKELDPDDQLYLQSKKDMWGYTELNNECRRIKERGPQESEEQAEKKTIILNEMTASMRKGAVEAKEVMDKKGTNKKWRLSNFFKRFEGESSSDYEKNLGRKTNIVLNDESGVDGLLASNEKDVNNFTFSIKKENGSLEAVKLNDLKKANEFFEETEKMA